MLSQFHTILIDKMNDRGVSPVIGTILMVSITVILAAVIGTFVFGIDAGKWVDVAQDLMKGTDQIQKGFN